MKFKESYKLRMARRLILKIGNVCIQIFSDALRAAVGDLFSSFVLPVYSVHANFLEMPLHDFVQQ